AGAAGAGAQVRAAAHLHPRAGLRHRRGLLGRLFGPGRRRLPALRDVRHARAQRAPGPPGLRALDRLAEGGGHPALPLGGPDRVRRDPQGGRGGELPLPAARRRVLPGRLPRRPPRRQRPPAGGAVPMSAHVKVLAGGLSTTIQDLGRNGRYAIGMPSSRAMDQYSFRVANLLLVNAEGQATLETTYFGPTQRFTAER